ncbi:MAG: hypothetical protein D6784_05935 [Chloroflexi bacterium]|nr:MAG: hypothetical protein D6784_05935 [Chloroflexota bacterium]
MNQRIKSVLILFILLATVSACAGPISRKIIQKEETFASTLPTPALRNLQVGMPAVLPPYGIRVQADAAVLTLRLTSKKLDTGDRLETLQKAINTLASAAANTGGLSFRYVSVLEAERDYSRGTAVPIPVETWSDSTSVLVRLVLERGDPPATLLESAATFNRFLNSLTLSPDVEVQTVSLRADIRDPEKYRQQIVDLIYQELEQTRQTYDSAVTFEISDLHTPLRILPLSDTEYYLYLEPVITVHEF